MVKDNGHLLKQKENIHYVNFITILGIRYAIYIIKCWKLQGKGILAATEEDFGTMDLSGKIVAVYTWG
ncbi:MAG: hypothetical protein PHC45_06025 [Clostridiaceae bacterium]|nr:hypothetical protein [Clostridiaceae bacterium]